MQFIDTHIHLQDFREDFAPHVLANQEAKRLVLAAAGRADFDKIKALVRAYPKKLIAAFGVHPWHYREEISYSELRSCLLAFPKALVGEVGVDGLKEPPGRSQYDLFSAQIEIARELSRPVIVHAARAFEALKAFETELKGVKFVHHGFVKNRELLKFINLCDGYIGLGRLFLRQEKALEMWRLMPQERVLFETDAPYQVKEEGYGEVVQENLAKLAEIVGEDKERLAAQLVKNAEEFLQC